MLMKAIMNDLKSTYRGFLNITIGLIGAMFLIHIQIDFVQGIMAFVYTVLLMVLFFGSFFFVISYFSKTMFKHQAYLYRSFPIKNSTVLLSKVIVGIIWAIYAGFIGMMSMLLMINIELPANIIFNFNAQDITMIMEIIKTVVIQYTIILLLAYFCICISYMDCFNSHRVAIGIISFFVIYNTFVFIVAKLGDGFIYEISKLASPFNEMVSYGLCFVVIGLLFSGCLYLMNHKTGVENN